MSIEINTSSLSDSASVLERLSLEWRDTALEISEIIGENNADYCRLSDCSLIIREYAELLKAITEKYETNEKSISIAGGELI